MSERLVLVGAAGAASALLISAVAQVLELRRLQNRLDERDESSAPAPGSGAKPRFGRIYEEKESIATVLLSHPSEAALGVAAICLIATVALGLGARPSTGATPGDVAIAGLHHTVDSLATRLGQLQDTVRLAAVAQAKDAPKPASSQVAVKPNTRSVARSAERVLPRAPASSEVLPPPPVDPSVAAKP